jgi:hypothetical protein
MASAKLQPGEGHNIGSLGLTKGFCWGYDLIMAICNLWLPRLCGGMLHCWNHVSFSLPIQ